jgi:broad specificity phosphatase PhoE
MKIYLARHGQSRWQLEPSDDLDTALTPLGHEQSERLATWLAAGGVVDGATRVEIATLCASPFKRSQETAGYVARALDLPLVTQPVLREAALHVADHLPRRETPLEPHPPFEPSDEYAAFKAQAREALDGLVAHAEAGEGPVLAITHGALIKTVLRIAADSDDVCFRLYNTALNLIQWRRGRWHLVHLNLWDHLPRELRTL